MNPSIEDMSPLLRASLVILLDRRIRAWLVVNDPKALAQLTDAVLVELTGGTEA